VKFIKSCSATAACAGILAAVWVGCKRPATAPPASPGRFELRAQAAPDLNRDADGNPLSVVVRVYQLKEPAAFSRLTFDLAAGARSDAELFDGACLGRTELVLVPGAACTATPELAPDTRYVGLVGLFRQPDPQRWRWLVSLERMTPPAPRPPRDWPWKRKAPGPRPLPWLAFTAGACALGRPEPGPEPIPGQPTDGDPACTAGSGARP